MGKLITGSDANQMAQGPVFNNTKKCLTFSELTGHGFTVRVSRPANRLVDISYVSYSGSGSQMSEYSVPYNFTLRTSGDIENEFLYYEYIVMVKPDNIEDFPNYNQNKCYATLWANGNGGSVNKQCSGTLFFPMNDDTNSVIIMVYKTSPGGNEYRCGYTMSTSVTGGAFGGQFTNQMNQEILASRITGSGFTLNAELTFFKNYSGEVLSTKNLKKEIKDILNDDE